MSVLICLNRVAARADHYPPMDRMSEHSFPTDGNNNNNTAFEAYLDTLAAALRHRSREQPLRDYCTGLLLPDGRKSVEPMAARLAPARARTMPKTSLNFVSEGAWSDDAVLAAMRRHVLPALEAHGPVRFRIVDEGGMLKKGMHSVGVARQYCGEVAKIDNCQVMVSLSVANDAACLPIAARLYLPEAWAQDDARRAAAGVPLDVVFQTKPAIALEQIRAARAAGVAPGIVLDVPFVDQLFGLGSLYVYRTHGLGTVCGRGACCVDVPCRCNGYSPLLFVPAHFLRRALYGPDRGC